MIWYSLSDDEKQTKVRHICQPSRTAEAWHNAHSKTNPNCFLLVISQLSRLLVTKTVNITLFAGNIRYFPGHWILVCREHTREFESITWSLIPNKISKERWQMVAASSLCSSWWPLWQVKKAPDREKGLC